MTRAVEVRPRITPLGRVDEKVLWDTDRAIIVDVQKYTMAVADYELRHLINRIGRAK